MGAAAPRTRLRDRRDRGQGRLVRPAAAARRAARAAALGRAFKWAPSTAITTLERIHMRVGRTGALNPWAQLEPGPGRRRHRLDATLHNEEDINRKGIRRGRSRHRPARRRRDSASRRACRRASSRHRRLEDADPLPALRRRGRQARGEVKHRCPNRACPSRGLETLIHWVSAAMDIEGVGEQFVRKLWDEGLLRSMPDLYRLTAEQLLEIEGYGEISAARAVDCDRAVEAAAVLPCPVRAQHAQDRLGARAQPGTPFRKRRRIGRGNPGGARAGRRASARIGQS